MLKRSVFTVTLGLLLALAMAVTAAAAEPNVGTPAFKAISSKSGTLKYGFKGAAVYDNALRKWSFYKMTTITRRKVEGYVNQINNNLALAAGLHRVAVYDFKSHAWREYKSGPDDSTAMLKNNFLLTSAYARVKILNGPYIKYQNGTWVRSR